LISNSNDDSFDQMSGQFLAAAFKTCFLKLPSSTVQEMRPSTPSIVPWSFTSARAGNSDGGHPRRLLKAPIGFVLQTDTTSSSAMNSVRWSSFSKNTLTACIFKTTLNGWVLA